MAVASHYRGVLSWKLILSNNKIGVLQIVTTKSATLTISQSSETSCFNLNKFALSKFGSPIETITARTSQKWFFYKSESIITFVTELWIQNRNTNLNYHQRLPVLSTFLKIKSIMVGSYFHEAYRLCYSVVPEP